MPGVAILPPTFPGPGFGSSHSEKSHLYLPDNTRDGHKPLPAMHNGSAAINDDLTVAEVKEKAKEDVRKAAKGFSAISLIKTARTQSQQARVHENQGELKAALGALLRAGILTHMFMNSPEFMAENKPARHGVLYKEFVDFQKSEGNNLTQRVQAIEAKLTDLEKSATTADNTEAGPSRRLGTSIADRVRKLNNAGLAVDTAKHPSRDFPVAPSTPLLIPLRSPQPTSTHKLSPTFVSALPPPPSSVLISSSNNSSTTSSPHAVVPPSSLGPPSPTSSASSSPPLVHTTIAEFSQTFPSIDELDEFTSRFPSVPLAQPTESNSPTHRSSISQSNGVNGVEMPISSHFKQFPSLSIDPGPRPSSTPITPTVNAFISRPASPAITSKPSINTLASSPLSSKPPPVPEKPAIPVSNTILPELLREYLAAPGLKILLVDIRTREEFDSEHIKADAIVCLEPSVLARPSATAASLEDSLVVAPREESVLFQNRDKFDLVVFYDTSSETHDAMGPLSAFVRAVHDNAYRKFLRHPPMLLAGGLRAWKQRFSDEVIRGVPAVMRAMPNNILEHGISSTSGTILPSMSIPDASRNRPSPGSSNVNGVLTERRLPELSPSPPGKIPENDSILDGTTSLVRRQAISKPPSSISHSHSQSESISQSPRPTIYSFSSSATGSTSITYPSVAPASLVVNNSSFSPTPSSYTPVSLPPQASINLARRRSEYMNGPTSPDFTHRPTSIDYPDLHVIRPPPPVATPVSERQDSRSHLLHSSSYAVLPPVSRTGPKPPTIQSDYPVMYWSDMQINTAGLRNLGNTCYMNATIQCLSATVPFARFFTDGRWKNAVNMVNPLGTKGSLAGAFARILYDMSHSELPHFNPFGFRKSICHHAAQFSGSDQHDSQEFLTFLLDGLHEDLNRVLTKPSHDSSSEREAELEKLPQQIASAQEWEIYRMRNDSLIVDYFQGQFRNRMECLTCHHTSTTYNSFMYLSLPIPSVKGPSRVSLDSCLAAFVKAEVLEKSEAWHCPRCKTLRSATKILSLSRLPPVLLIHLKRFSVKGPFTDKIETIVDFPLKGLDLTNYMPPPLPPDTRKNGDKLTPTPTSGANDPRVQVPPYKYDLYGVTNHFGSLSNGHYTAFIASRPGWLYCDDSRITAVDTKEVVGRPAYVLYYKRVKT